MTSIETENQDIKSREDEPKSANKGLKIFAILGLSIVLLLGIGGYYLYSQLQPLNPTSQEKIQVTIPMGTSVLKIGEILQEKNIIANAKLFYYYAKYKKESGFQAGDYYLSPNMSLAAIMTQLKEGKLSRDVIRFTVAEGLSTEQIATQLEKKGLVNKEKFLSVVNEGNFEDISFVQEIPKVKDRKYRLEGFLFPETYEIDKDASEEDIIRVMLKQFERELKPEWLSDIKNKKMSLYELVTLASIVEREVIVDKERKIIAGVFQNRIHNDWLLQSCATVQFVLGKQRDRLLFEDLEIESPYNTYKNPGLPPSPIANPGRQSLEAAIYPAKHDYFFFVTKKDGTGEHHFAKTFKEHQKNDAKSRGNF